MSSLNEEKEDDLNIVFLGPGNVWKNAEDTERKEVLANKKNWTNGPDNSMIKLKTIV